MVKVVCFVPLFDPNERFSCARCGRCCGKGLNEWWLELLPVEVQRLRESGLLKGVRFRNGRAFLARGKEGSCVFLNEDNLCTLRIEYGWHPLGCRLFPLGVYIVNSTLFIYLNRPYARKIGCKGLGKGETLGAQIDRVLDALRDANVIKDYYADVSPIRFNGISFLS